MSKNADNQSKSMDRSSSEARRQIAFDAFMVEVDAIEPVTPTISSVDAVRALRGGET